MENVEEEEKMKKILIIPCAVLIISLIVMASADDPKGITGTCKQGGTANPVANCSTMLCYKQNVYACTTRADEYGEYTVDLSLPTWNPPGPEAGDYDKKAWKHIDEHLWSAYNGFEDFDPEGTYLRDCDFELTREDE